MKLTHAGSSHLPDINSMGGGQANTCPLDFIGTPPDVCPRPEESVPASATEKANTLAVQIARIDTSDSHELFQTKAFLTSKHVAGKSHALSIHTPWLASLHLVTGFPSSLHRLGCKDICPGQLCNQLDIYHSNCIMESLQLQIFPTHCNTGFPRNSLAIIGRDSSIQNLFSMDTSRIGRILWDNG